MNIRPVLALATLALLGACNMVVTKEPVFSKADAAGAPVLRPGVWNGDPEADCKVDESKSLTKWPSCASGFVVVDDHTVGGFDDREGKRAWTTDAYLLAAGEPRIIQVKLADEMHDATMPPMYLYGAFQPTRFDAQGRIIAGRSWAVLCGPPPPERTNSASGKQRTGTLHPFPGLTMDADGNNCTPDTPAALRNAARESGALTAAKDLSGSHWVRDGRQ